MDDLLLSRPARAAQAVSTCSRLNHADSVAMATSLLTSPAPTEARALVPKQGTSYEHALREKIIEQLFSGAGSRS